MRNPAWTVDELILALDVYFTLEHKDITVSNPAVIELSELLRSLPVHRIRPDEDRFRNPNGVSMELRNYLKFDLNYSGIGLTRGCKLQAKVWTDYAENRSYLRKVAAAIRKCLPLAFRVQPGAGPGRDGVYTGKHTLPVPQVYRERCSKSQSDTEQNAGERDAPMLDMRL